MGNKATFIKISLLIIYCILVFNYPITMIIIGIVLYSLYNWAMSDKENRSNKWIDGYYKKDGTYVNGHRRRNK